MIKYFLFNLGLVILNVTTLKSQVANIQDSVQLVTLYNTTDGQNWTNNSGWLTPGPLRFWHGVSLNSSGRVTSISLTNNNLTGVIPYINLPALQSLLLNSNHLSDTIPNLNLPALQHLNLSANDLTGKIPNFTLPALQTLSLIENDLTDTIPNFNLPNLKSLTLNSNQLSGNIPSFNLPALEVLYLQRNNLTGTIPELTLPSLTNLSFTFNQLTDTIPNFNFPELIGLNLNHNLLTGRIPNFDFPNLTILDVSYNQLTDTIPNFNFPNLQLLHLESNQLTGTIPQFNFPVLQILDLWGNQLSGNIPAFNFPVLQTLALQINGLSGPVPHFNVPATTTINLGFNKLLFDGLEELKQNHPTAIYSPQAGIIANKKDSTLSVTAGGTISNNEYKWYRNNQLVATITGDSTYVSSVQGFYSVSVTNSVATGLTLTSTNILEMLPPIFKIDPNPSVILPNGTIDPNLSGLNLADSVRGAATDGVTKILLICNSASALKFWISGNNNGKLSGLGSQGSPTTEPIILQPSNGKVVAVFHAPDGFGNNANNQTRRDIYIRVSSQNGIDSTSIDFLLATPPVVMVHGMWSSPFAWKEGGFEDNLRFRGFPYPFKANYMQNSFRSFDPYSPESIPGRLSVESAIHEGRKFYKDIYKIATAQVDIVAHSLGGLMSRSFSQQPDPVYKNKSNYYKGYIHKLITLGTPHKGSPLGPVLYEHQNIIATLDFLGTDVPIAYIDISRIMKWISNPIGTVHRDFEEWGEVIQNNLLQTPPYYTHSIAGDYSSPININNAGYRALNVVLFILTRGRSHSEIFKVEGCPNPNEEPANDIIVPIYSQTGGIANNTIFQGTAHSSPPGYTTETNNEDIHNKVAELLLSSNPNDFSLGFPKAKDINSTCYRNIAEKSSFIHQNRVSNSNQHVNIISPTSGTSYQQNSGSTITLQYEALGGCIPRYSVFMVEGIGWYETDTISNPFSISFTIPENSPTGRRNIALLVADTAGNIFADTMHITITPVGQLDSLVVNPTAFVLDSALRSRSIYVEGYFSEGQNIIINDLTNGSTGTIYTPLSGNVFTVSENGLVTALSAGLDTLVISNGGKLAKIPITVSNNFQNVHYYPNAISFPEIPDKIFGDLPFRVNASATSGDDIVFTVVSGPGTIQNGILTMDTTGQITIKASQSGNVYFAAAADVTRSFCVKPISPAIVKNCNILSSTIPDNNQWFKDGVAISGATNQSLFITSTGTYTVKVTSNGCPSDASNSIIAVSGSFVPTPEITAGSATVFCEGGNAVLSSNAPAGNQWHKDGTAINGAANTTYQATSSGVYSTKVTVGGCESANSNVISVTVNSIPPTPLISQNGNQLVSSAATGNQWYLNGVIISGATGSNYSPVASGSYTVQVVINGCNSAMSATYNFIVTGIPNIDVFGGQVNVWPNPVSDMLTITKSGSMPSLAIRLFDINGRLLVTQSVNSASTAIDMRRYATGVYVLWIENISSRIKAKKMIIKL